MVSYAFIEYDTAEEAQRAVAEGDNKRLDVKHILRVNAFADWDTFTKTDAKFEEPTRSDFESKANLNSWLLDETGRDQFVVRHGMETEVFWNDPVRQAGALGRTLNYGGEREKQKDKVCILSCLFEWDVNNECVVR